MPDAVNRDRSAGGAGLYAVAFAAILAVRLCLLATPGYPGDLYTYEEWALRAGTLGVHTVYDAGARARFDYPPLDAYLLAPMGWIYARFAPDHAAHFDGSSALGALVKLPPLVFDAALAALLAFVARRIGLPAERRRAMGFRLACTYLALPAVLYDSGHWGQPDSVHAFFVLAALTSILLGRPGVGWCAAALGCLMKPLAWPFLPLLAAATWSRGGFRALLRGAAAACATAIVVFLPFIATGRGSAVVRRIFFDVDAMPFTSVNAHNLWWLLGPWRRADASWLGPFTATEVGLLLFGTAYALVLAGIWRAERSGAPRARPTAGSELSGSDAWFLGAGLVAFAFFFFSTHMHENHLFSALPFLGLLAHRGSRWAVLAVLVSVASTVNMLNHDMLLAPLLYPGDSGVQRLLRDGSLLVPPAMYSVATANSIATVLLLSTTAWAFARITRPEPSTQSIP